MKINKEFLLLDMLYHFGLANAYFGYMYSSLKPLSKTKIKQCKYPIRAFQWSTTKEGYKFWSCFYLSFSILYGNLKKNKKNAFFDVEKKIKYHEKMKDYLGCENILYKTKHYYQTRYKKFFTK